MQLCEITRNALNAIDGQASYVNLTAPVLLEQAIRQREGELTANGALAVLTGEHTGRSAADKFVVRDTGTQDTVWWGPNAPMSPELFNVLLQDFVAHAKGIDLHRQDLIGGADANYAVQAQIYLEYAWHALFIQYLLRAPTPEQRAAFSPGLTIINLPSFRADPQRHGVNSHTVVALDLTRRIVLIGGTSYAGETKKSVFSFLNYVLPERGVMPMHCSANVGPAGDSAVFFGLSGTGKTTLSNDPARPLIGDDEHGWSDDGVFNFEGGCYAKTIKLSREAEPEIWDATNNFGTVLENVVVDPVTRKPDFNDGSLTANTRSAYPLAAISNAHSGSCAGHPKNIVMLCADAFGVLPPIARLTASQAMYHFLSGYTAKVAGTEKGMASDEATATFSTCFGLPFMPCHPSVYGNLLRTKIDAHGTQCWLVNTGWTGGAFGTGERMPIRVTRTLLNEALSGGLDTVDYRTCEIFGFQVPVSVDGIDDALLTPRATWADGTAYDAQAARLGDMFASNFERFAPHVDSAVRDAGPQLLVAAE